MLKLRLLLCFIGTLAYSQGMIFRRDVAASPILENVKCFDMFTNQQGSLIKYLPVVVARCESPIIGSESTVEKMCEDLISWNVCKLKGAVNDNDFDNAFGIVAEQSIVEYGNESTAKKVCQSLSFLNITDCLTVCGEEEGKHMCSYYSGMVTELQEQFKETMMDKEGYKYLDKYKHAITSLVPFPPLGSLHSNLPLSKCLGSDTTAIHDVCNLVGNIAVISMQAHAKEIIHEKFLSHENRRVNCEPLKEIRGACEKVCLKEQASDLTQSICSKIALGVEQLYGAEHKREKVEETTAAPVATNDSKPDPISNQNTTGEGEMTTTTTDPTTTEPNQPVETPTPGPVTTKSLDSSAIKTSGNITKHVDASQGASTAVTKPTTSKAEVPVNQTESATVPFADHNAENKHKTAATGAQKENIATAKLTAETTVTEPTTTSTVAASGTVVTATTGDDLDTEVEDQQTKISNKDRVQDETDKATNIQVKYEEQGKGSNILSYFLVFTVLCIAGYVVFQNKHKIIALVVEGKAGAGRRPSTKKYKKLKTEDVMPSLEQSASSKTYVF